MDFSTTFDVDFMSSVFPHLLEEWPYYTEIQYESVFLLWKILIHI